MTPSGAMRTDPERDRHWMAVALEGGVLADEAGDLLRAFFRARRIVVRG